MRVIGVLMIGLLYDEFRLFFIAAQIFSCIYIYDDVTTCSPTAPLNIPTTTVLICENKNCFLFCIANYRTVLEGKYNFQ